MNSVTARIVGVGVALLLVAGSAHAAQHGERPSHEVSVVAEHGAQDETHQDTHGEAHHPEAINWVQFGGTRTDEHGAVKPNPPPFIATVINFLIMVGIVYWAIRRKVNPALADRRAAIEAEINEAKRLQAEAEALHKEYTERLAKMEAELAALREEFIKAGQAEYDRIIAEARARAERMQREGESMIQQEVQQLRSDLMREAVEAAIASAEQTIKTAMDTSDHHRLADEFVARLEERTTRGALA